tara:strand:- start:649 stop:1959 length:1311 start_codon:yes stop_codon:yes gene_type:complete
MISKIANIFKVKDLRKKIFFTLSLLVVFRLGGQVTLPGIQNPDMSAAVGGLSILELYDQFVGNFLSQASIFSLGIMPYISASIIIQLMTAIVPYFQRLKKEGPEGNKKIIQLTRYGTVFIAAVQAIGVATLWSGQAVPFEQGGMGTGLFYSVTIISLVTGTIFVMWLGEQITDYGIGNGISLIITVGILAGAPTAFSDFFGLMMQSSTQAVKGIVLFAILIGIVTFTVLITSALRKIPVQFAKRVVGRKVYGGQASHIPLKILTAGVMPIIFAQALMFIPQLLGQFTEWSWLLNGFAPTAWAYNIVFAILVIIFTYFYTAIAFNPADVADNMQKQGGFIPGVRPGKATSDFIDNILTRVTLPASIALAFIAILPFIFQKYGNIDYSFAIFFGGTSIIIAVGVALDTMQQIEGHLVSRHYDGFLKTGRIKGRSKTRF